MSPARLLLTVALLVVAFARAWAKDTQRFYLSGHGKDDPVPWKFYCTTGALSGFWTNIPVPSNWELQGFGHLTYKKDYSNSITECGLYEMEFFAPDQWSGSRAFLVFEGAMTDTSAKLNGRSVGPTHQGGFYRFKYEVTKLLELGASNKLEVTVAKHSANESVNRAERLADYWVFGGVYRPVYLEVVPRQCIERVAIEARAEGDFKMDVFLNGVTDADAVEAQVMTLDGEPAGAMFASPLRSRDPLDRIRLQAHLASVDPWTAETPHLYSVEVRLKRGDEVLHRYSQRFGFRTFEVRDGDGLYLNGQRIILKGVNRHSAWPTSGRCLSEAVHRLDIETIKDMNGNAVRMSHYPPDVQFLDLCDELGLYVLDELAGWHNHYDNEVGAKLVEEMVTRDVNHPSILFWDNGNEGGFNTNLDHLFAKFDPQQRRVLHPWAPFSGINTAHYLAYSNAQIAATGAPMYYDPRANAELLNTNLPSNWIYLPTEFLHGLYDGGAGAGLEDYWNLMMSHPRCAGGFIWVFADEGIVRPDTGEMDTAGNQAPDGIVGPYREREGSFYTIKDIWSPMQAHYETNGTLRIENHYSFTDASQCRFSVTIQPDAEPGDALSRRLSALNGQLRNFTLQYGSIPPGSEQRIQLDALALTRAGLEFLLTIDDPSGKQLWSWAWCLPIAPAKPDHGDSEARFSETDDDITLGRSGIEVSFSKRTGMLTSFRSAFGKCSLSNGPRPISGRATLKRIQHQQQGDEDFIIAEFDGDLIRVKWQLSPNGTLKCDYRFFASGTHDAVGVAFDYPEYLVRGKRWLGDGPNRVWKNRLRGVRLGLWKDKYNNTIPGYRYGGYPEFKGCFTNVRNLRLDTSEGFVEVVPGNIPYIQVLTPEQPPDNLVGKTKVNLPNCGLGFLHAIPPIGTKFKPAEQGGPQGEPNVGQGEYSGSVSFSFYQFP